MGKRGRRLRFMRHERALLRRAIMKAHRLADIGRVSRRRTIGACVESGRFWSCWVEVGGYGLSYGYSESIWLSGCPF